LIKESFFYIRYNYSKETRKHNKVRDMTKNEIIDFIKTHKKDLQEQLGVTKIGLFGSYARDEAREDSDIDIAVELSDANKADNYFKLLHFFEDHLKLKIDLGIESCIKPAVKDNVQKEIIYV